MIVWTEPLPKERVPRTVARFRSCRAPATISDAEAEPPLIEHDHRLAVRQIARAGIEAAGFVGIAAAGRDHFAALQESVGDVDRLIEQTARIEAQVEHIALELVGRNFRLDLLDRLLQVVIGLFGEGDDAEIADIAFDARLDGANGDDVADDRQFDRLVGALAQDGQLDRRVDGAAHLVDGFFELEAAHRLAVDLRDVVAGKNAGLGGGRIVDRGDDLDEFVFHRHFDAETAEFTLGLGAHVFGILGIHVARMRIERGEHAVDGVLDQLVFCGGVTYWARTRSKTSPKIDSSL